MNGKVMNWEKAERTSEIRRDIYCSRDREEGGKSQWRIHSTKKDAERRPRML